MNESSLSALLPPYRLLLLGFGHVGQAFLPLLASRSEWLGSKLGARLVISGIGTRSKGYYIHPKGIDADTLAQEAHPLQYFSEISTRMESAEAFIVEGSLRNTNALIELTTLDPRAGQPALSYIRLALHRGLHVITANKGPVAHAQFELQELAHQYHVQFRFESTVMDGLPVINLANYTLQAVGIQSFRALLNTTSSIVLNMIEQGYSLEEAIAQTKHKGVAEADPWYDLDGWDAAMKTTILANSLLDGQLTPNMVEREGIRNLSPDEISAAAQAGTPIRLVGSAHRNHGLLVAKVRPQQLGATDVLQLGLNTGGLLSLETEAMGSLTLIEHDTLPMQTAYGVLSDLIAVIREGKQFTGSEISY
jgi:homoserine dehydrogenase